MRVKVSQLSRTHTHTRTGFKAITLRSMQCKLSLVLIKCVQLASTALLHALREPLEKIKLHRPENQPLMKTPQAVQTVSRMLYTIWAGMLSQQRGMI